MKKITFKDHILTENNKILLTYYVPDTKSIEEYYIKAMAKKHNIHYSDICITGKSGEEYFTGFDNYEAIFGNLVYFKFNNEKAFDEYMKRIK
jgi:hypothetical protein